jgi:dipeptidyl aminopeptidase/acylaminoacyl peptidase
VTDVRTYLSARRTVSPTCGPEGRLAFLSDITGTTQVWTVDGPRQWPEQRTFYDERVSFVSWSPAGDSIAFGKDSGADEHDQLFVLDPETGDIEQVTDRPDAIHAWGGWHPDGDRIAFAANRREQSNFDVYVMDLADGEASLVSEGEGRLDVTGWSPSGDRLLVRDARASSDDDLSVLDVETGEQRYVTPHDGDVRYRHPTFGPDGEAIYCASDANADTKELVRIDLDSLDVETVESGDEWSVEQFEIDTDTRRIALTRNVDGYADCHVGRLAAATEVATTDVEIPPGNFEEGVVHAIAFGPDGTRLALAVSSTNLNHSIFVVEPGNVDDYGVPATERWTTPSTGGLHLDEFAAPDLVRYESFDNREIPTYVTLPEGADSGNPVPVIVDIHGGPHHQRRPWFRPIRQYFLDQGFAVFEPNVRGSSGYGREYAALDDVEQRMDSVRDISAGVEWLADHPAIDADAAVAYGRSYGGFMVLSAITEYPQLWTAAVEFVGIANWVTFLENTGDWRQSHREAEYGSLAEDRELLEDISPIHAVDEIQCPLFIQHGENDPRVPVAEARQIATALDARDVPVETCIFEDEGHHTTKLENRIEQFECIGAFLDEHVAQ